MNLEFNDTKSRDLLIGNQEELKLKILDFLKNEMYGEAYCLLEKEVLIKKYNKNLLTKGEVNELYKKGISLSFIDKDMAILMIMLIIYNREKDNIVTIFNAGNRLEDLTKHYYNIKFLLKRIEFDFSRKLQQEVIEYFNKYKVSKEAILEIVDRSIIYKAKVLENLQLILQGKFIEHNLDNVFIGEYKSKKIAFIFCVNNEILFKEAKNYINNLYIPENFEIEIIAIRNAKSITSAYNQAMKKTNADYKVYLHQDVFITNRNFLIDIYNIFESDEKIGLIGMAGSEIMSLDGVWWNISQDKKYYTFISQDIILYNSLCGYINIEQDYKKVQIIDGVMMITSKDIEWREDIFKGWHYYDISQSMEFARKGYYVAIPKYDKNKVWCIHEQKCNKKLGEDFHINKRLFLKEYRKELKEIYLNQKKAREIKRGN